MRSGKELIRELCERVAPDLRAEFEQVFAQLDVTRGWTEAASSNPRFESFSANSGSVTADLLPKAYLGSSDSPHQTLDNITWTTITGMSDTVVSRGLPVDTTGYEWIGLVNNPKFNFYLVQMIVPFATHATGDRKLRVQLYDDVAAAWGTSFEVSKTQTVTVAGGEPLMSGVAVLNFQPTTQKWSRIRFQAFQSSGGSLAISIPQFLVCQLP